MSGNGGAYLLHFRLRRPALVTVGRLGRHRFEPGRYVYVGSAQRHLAQRVARHCRLATSNKGARHWHIDGVLLHRFFVLEQSEMLPGADECRLSAELARQPGVTAPVPGFGATDCAAGCRSHFYRVAGADDAA